MKQRARRPDVQVIFHWGKFSIDLRLQADAWKDIYFWALLLLEKLL